MSKGKREATRNGWHTGGNPFGEESKKKTKKRGGKKIALIALGCIIALAAVVAVAWDTFVVPPDVSDNDRPGVTDKTNQTQPEGTKPSEDGDTVVGRKEDYYTFLLIGKDTSSASTDTMILVSYDVPSQQVNMMSIPRDTVVNVPWSVKKINSVYSAKESNGGGLENLKKQVGYLTGVEPDFYVMIEWKAVGEIVNAVGGVEFNVPRNMNYDDPYQDLHIHLNKGVQTLTGEQAMAMLRYRTDNDKSIGYGDTGRTETQREFLKAMAKEVLQLGNMTKIGKFIEIFMKNVETDLKLNELMWFASKALNVDLSTMQSSTMPYIDVGYFRGGYYFLANPEEIIPVVNEQFNPYNRDISTEDLQVVQRNKDGSCYVTNGELLDSKWGKAYSGSVTSTPSSSITTSKSPGTSSNNTSSSETTQPEGGGETTVPEGEAAQQPTEGETDAPAEGETGETGEAGESTSGEGTELPVEGTEEVPPSDETGGEATVPQEPIEGSGVTEEPGTPTENTPPAEGGTADSQVPGWLQPSE